jgi:hypothetical protein
VTPARAEYRAAHRYPDAVNLFHYAGTEPLVPCRSIAVSELLELPNRLVGKRLRVRIVVEEAR